MRRCLATIALCALSFAGGGCSDGRLNLNMIQPRLSVDQQIVGEFVTAMNEKSSLGITLVPNDIRQRSGIQALLDGEADVALVSNNEPFAAGVTAVMPMYTNVLHVLISRELLGNEASPLAEIEALRRTITAGSRIFAGPPGSPSREMLVNFARYSGIPGGTLRFDERPVIDFDDCPDVLVLFAPILRDTQRYMESCTDGTKYILPGLDSPDNLGRGSSVEASTLLNPSLRAFVIPAGLYGDSITPYATVTLAVDKILIAREGVPAAAIYDLISEVLRLRPALAATEPTLFHGLEDDFGAAASSFILHPGAQAYIERNEPSIYERYSGVAEVAVTVFLAALSGVFAAVRIYNIRRKNRIDVFYKEAIRLRKTISDESSSSERNSAITRVRMLQTKAFDMLVDEKLAADESFRIFVTLSNDIIGELKQPSAPDWEARKS